MPIKKNKIKQKWQKRCRLYAKWRSRSWDVVEVQEGEQATRWSKTGGFWGRTNTKRSAQPGRESSRSAQRK